MGRSPRRQVRGLPRSDEPPEEARAAAAAGYRFVWGVGPGRGARRGPRHARAGAPPGPGGGGLRRQRPVSPPPPRRGRPPGAGGRRRQAGAAPRHLRRRLPAPPDALGPDPARGARLDRGRARRRRPRPAAPGRARHVPRPTRRRPVPYGPRADRGRSGCGAGPHRRALDRIITELQRRRDEA